MEKQFSIVIILFLSLLADLPAQISIQRDVVGAGGGQIGSLSFGSLEWTLGEFMTERLQTDQTLITQGFHQPFLIIDNIAEATPNILIEAFPNPTASILHLKTATSTPLDVKLLDLTGKEILSKHFALGTQLDFFKKVPKGENTQLELWVDLPPQRFVDGVLITDTDPLNEIQKLLKDGGFISLSKNGGLILLEDDDPVNELQDLGYETESSPEGQIGKLSINGAGYSEEWGDTIVIEDVDPINELQELRYEVGEGPSGLLGKISITGGFMGGLWGRTFTINDVDPNNELQKIVSGGIRPSSVHPIGWNKLLLLQEFIPDDPTDNDYVEVDAHPENELQLLQFDEDRALLSVTKGNEVDLSSLATPWRKADTFDVPPPAIHYSGTAIGKSYQTESQEILIQKDAFRIKQAFSELDFARLAKTQFGGREGGYLGLYQAGATRIFANAGEAGDLKLYGGNNSLNVRISHLDGSPIMDIFPFIMPAGASRPVYLPIRSVLGSYLQTLRTFACLTPKRLTRRFGTPPSKARKRRLMSAAPSN